MKMKLYHGTNLPLVYEEKKAIYATSDIETAKEFAICLDDLGNYNRVSYLYEIEVEGDIEEIDDFDMFDTLGYSLPEEKGIYRYPELNWYCIFGGVKKVRLVEKSITNI